MTVKQHADEACCATRNCLDFSSSSFPGPHQFRVRFVCFLGALLQRVIRFMLPDFCCSLLAARLEQCSPSVCQDLPQVYLFFDVSRSLATVSAASFTHLLLSQPRSSQAARRQLASRRDVQAEDHPH